MKTLVKYTCALISLLICLLSFSAYSRPKLLNYSNNVIIYTGASSSNAVIKRVDSGYFSIQKIYGESCLFSLTPQEIFDKFDVTILFTEVAENVVCYYGYSKKFPYEKEINGKIVNVHVAIENDRVTFGTPIIYGSF